MAEDRLKVWEGLFRKALILIDSIRGGIAPTQWSFGGGTVLMLKYQHRFSKDVDIFVPDPQYLNYLTPRLNDTAEGLTGDYVESARFLKLRFTEGEIDFVASAHLTHDAVRIERLLDRDVQVETASEIVAKKVWHRGDHFTARDIFDLAMVCEQEPEALYSIQPILRDRRAVVLARIESDDPALREAFAALEVMNYRRTYEECVERVMEAMSK
ncbi:MAG: nucleotidyl transferase AbiEii/AbiGii toxin family protein [Betaproteobacteria bacterium]|nr:nucleotidyl transferase AbiEii/AbiGii toxin family protein [Betaproteobacteria bacterium]